MSSSRAFYFSNSHRVGFQRYLCGNNTTCFSEPVTHPILPGSNMSSEISRDQNFENEFHQVTGISHRVIDKIRFLELTGERKPF